MAGGFGGLSDFFTLLLGDTAASLLITGQIERSLKLNVCFGANLLA